MGWQEYQEEIAHLFRDLGCSIAIERTIDGARSSHRVDVLVEFSTFGIGQLWIIESKFWKTPVTKEKVLALQKTVNDTGADRGILVSESGFQSGAINAATKTNIQLTNLDDLRNLSKDDLYDGMLFDLEQRADEICHEIVALTYITKKTGADSSYSYPNPEFDARITGRVFADLAALSAGFKDARFRKFPAIIGFEKDGWTPILVSNLGKFADAASRIVWQSEAIWEDEKKRKSAAE